MNYGAAIGMPLVTWAAPLAGFVVNVALNCWLVPAIGIVGASVSSTAAYAVVLVGGTVGLHRVRSRISGR